jgi:arsenate reductase
MINVLVLCTGNSARSVLAECLINDLGQGQWRAFSAGSKPTGKVNPLSIEILAQKGHATAGLRSKSWDEFAGADAPKMDLVITVCDNAANEPCPIWPGAPKTIHVGFPDPAAAEGSHEQRLAVFADVYAMIRAKIERLLAVGLQRAHEV